MQEREEIKRYWDERAKEFSKNTAATTNDIHLRELEIKNIIQTLKLLDISHNGKILDVGCGDGYSTARVAKEFPDHLFYGVDYSEKMINIARDRINNQPLLKDCISFSNGDVTELKNVFKDLEFNVIISDRCLINLESMEMQSAAIAQIAHCLIPGGYYIAIENFIEGQENMNKARREVGLQEIPVRWHNLYFKEKDFLLSAERYFDDIVFHDFSSSYYFATRVIYSAMCKMRGEEPNYNHEIHQLAVDLPEVGKFSPIRMVVMKRKAQ